MTDAVDNDRTFIGYVICLLIFAFIAWSFYPGVMTADSMAAHAQGRANVYGDINAPLMSYLWGGLDWIVPGPALIFVIHLAIFWIGAALLWRATVGRSMLLGLALILFGLAPQILSQTVVIWKDVALGVSLFAATALVYFARAERNKIALLLSTLVLFYGYASRLNAFPAVLPIAIWSGFVALEIFEFERRRVAAFVFGLGYFALLSTAVYGVTYRLTGGETDHPFQQVYLYDLAAISVETNEPLFPEYVTNDRDFSFDTVRVRYNERSVADLIFVNVPNEGDLPPLKLTRDAAEVAYLGASWRATVAAHPAAYLRHRARVFAQLIGLRWSVTAPFASPAVDPQEFEGGGNFGSAVLSSYFGLFRRPLAQTFFFRGVVWIAICVLLAYAAIRRRLESDWDLVFVLAISSLLFAFAYFPTTPSTEFRYLFWPAIASTVALIFGIYLWASEKAADVDVLES